MQVELAQLRYRLPRLRGRGLQLSQQGGGIGTRRVRARPSWKSTGGGSNVGCRSSKPISTGSLAPRDAAQVSAPARCSRGCPGRLHQRGEVHAAQRADAFRRCRRGPALLHARPHGPASAPPRRRNRPARGHRRVRAAAPAPTGRGVPFDARRGRRRRPAGTSRRRQLVGSRRADRGRPHGACARSVPANVPELLVFNKLDVADPDGIDDLLAAHPGSVTVSAVDRRRRGEARRSDQPATARARNDRRAARAVRPRRRARGSAPRRRGPRRGARRRGHEGAGPNPRDGNGALPGIPRPSFRLRRVRPAA